MFSPLFRSTTPVPLSRHKLVQNRCFKLCLQIVVPDRSAPQSTHTANHWKHSVEASGNWTNLAEFDQNQVGIFPNLIDSGPTSAELGPS